MFKTMRATLLKDLPEDVVIDILLRLPAKTLMGLRCVCRSWKTLITHPTFIKMHLNRTCLYRNNDDYLHYFNFGSHNSRKLVWCLMSAQTHEHQLELEIPLPVPIESPESKIVPVLIGTFNGLLCLTYNNHHFGRTLCLWNPSIRKSKILSLSSSSSILPFPQHYDYENYYALGFGFDSRTNDYKIVRIRYCRDYNCECIANSAPPAEVYSLATDSWRRIESVVPCYGSCRQSEAFFNGSLHWVAFRSVAHPDRSKMIMSFDISGEVFGEMMLPDGVHRCALELVALKESLSCVCWDKSGQFDIWVMKEYGVVESWTKQFSVAMPASIERSLGFTKNNVIYLHLVTMTQCREMFSYDLGSLQPKNLGIRLGHYTSHVCPFMETLTLLGGQTVEEVI